MRVPVPKCIGKISHNVVRQAPPPKHPLAHEGDPPGVRIMAMGATVGMPSNERLSCLQKSFGTRTVM